MCIYGPRMPAETQHREKYDLVTARAVADEYFGRILPAVSKNQTAAFIALKGSKYQEEIAAADKALQILGGRLVSARLP